MTLAFRGHRLCSSWQNGTGIVWDIEPYLALMIGGPPAIPAGIPTGDFTGSKGMTLKGRIFVDTSRMRCLVNGYISCTVIAGGSSNPYNPPRPEVHELLMPIPAKEASPAN